ncbi:hypothetical protein PR048_027167 [Dryococelus australis]|uniref:39S ribosomal protein L20, mitochondrial n=1 Tax=Dryococelus australis TaxID=614101 RepID=A0ABQ9GG59_9NEOP|nr:hypothetical protein PR048_027167 [Dryococelus australis]
MVFQTLVLFTRSRGPDSFWRNRKIFKLSAVSFCLFFFVTGWCHTIWEFFQHYIGRRRNCYSIAIRNVHRALVYATKGRKLKKQDMKDLWDVRLTAACEEHDFSYPLLAEGLSRCNILLNRKSLTDLAIWEPRSFKVICLMPSVRWYQKE